MNVLQEKLKESHKFFSYDKFDMIRFNKTIENNVKIL